MSLFIGAQRVTCSVVAAPVLAVLALTCLDVLQADETSHRRDLEKDYVRLLALFPEQRQGYGKDMYLGFVGDQPMTLGFVVSAEAIHMLHSPNDESHKRLQEGVRWLLANRDLDKDGAPGWGLPQPWDTWEDGTENPPDHPYTITTAIAMQGLLDALQVPSMWNEREEIEIKRVLVEVTRRWCREVWSEGYGGGYFWYSPRPEDNVFGINASAMFLASLSRLLAEQGDFLTKEDQELFSQRRDALASAIVATVELRKGAPFWKYAAQPNRYNNTRRNDLVHHIYTLWGIETYRDLGGPVKLPWSRDEAIDSVNRFWRNGKPSRFAQDSKGQIKQQPRLWSIGMMLAFYAKWGDQEHTESCFQSIHEQYGSWPQLTVYPMTGNKDGTFYPRHAAHVLYGLSLRCFGKFDIGNG